MAASIYIPTNTVHGFTFLTPSPTFVVCLIAQLGLTLCDPMDCNPPSSSVRGDSPGKRSGMGSFSLLQGNLPNPGIEFRSPTLQADSLPSKPPGKPKSTAVDSLSLLQEIFPTQELNWGLLHCRWILYQLSYQGSPSRHMGETVSSCTFMHVEAC